MTDVVLKGLFFQNARGMRIADSGTVTWSFDSPTNTLSAEAAGGVNPTAPATETRLGIELPVASNFGAEEDCGGVAFASGIAGQGGGIRADAANNRAELVFIAGDLSNQPMYFQFQYQVI
jgi:hypothetical protein